MKTQKIRLNKKTFKYPNENRKEKKWHNRIGGERK